LAGLADPTLDDALQLHEDVLPALGLSERWVRPEYLVIATAAAADSRHRTRACRWSIMALGAALLRLRVFIAPVVDAARLVRFEDGSKARGNCFLDALDSRRARRSMRDGSRSRRRAGDPRGLSVSLDTTRRSG
jgi:hypothetical protein